MNPCTRLSERVPEVVHGRASWSPDELRHLESCADCRAEWALVAAARDLGARLAPPDSVRIASRVLERTTAARGHGPRTMRRALAGLAAAAAVAMAVWRGWGDRPPALAGYPRPAAPLATAPRGPAPGHPVPAGARPELPLPELDGLPAEALDTVLRALDEPLAQSAIGGAGDLDDGGDRELELVLAGEGG